MAKQGRIKKVFEDRGFGFIRPDDGTHDVWFNAPKVRGAVKFEDLQAGTVVRFESQPGDLGPRAKWVEAVATGVPQTSGQPASTRQAAPAEQQPYRFLNPYNFVRFLATPTDTPADVTRPPDLTILARCPPPPHDRYLGRTGRITCELEAVTPLFVSDSHEVQLHGEHKSYEFFKLGGQPAIPGTSLRGMVRSVFEAATNSCLPLLTDARLSYHLPTTDALKLVPARVVRSKDESWRIELLTGTSKWTPGQRPKDIQYAAWVPRYVGETLSPSNSASVGGPYASREKVELPDGLGHGSPCWAVLRRVRHPLKKFEFWSVKQIVPEAQDHRLRPVVGEHVARGYLVINNQNIENKHDERFFFYRDGQQQPETAELSDIVRERYSELIRDYQERHSPHVRERRDPAKPDGDQPAFSRFILDRDAAVLKAGDVVYAMLDESRKVQFLVPVAVPRVMCDHTIRQLLPGDSGHPLTPCDKFECLCPACRMFGWVHEAPTAQDPAHRVAYAGRVSFSHATLVSSAGTLPPTPLAILGSPKPTTIRMYLETRDGQVGERWTDQREQAGYDPEWNQLRGRKFYRHHGAAREQEYYRADGRADGESCCDNQNRTVRDGLAPGAKFSFTVHFENLAPAELGALLWSLELEPAMHHRLGFAKPLGFGSVKVKVCSLELLDPACRYGTLSDSGWRSEEGWAAQHIGLFQRTIFGLYESAAPVAKGFAELPNIADLRAILGPPPGDLPVHYPRTGQTPDPIGKNFEWFMENKKRENGYALAHAPNDAGLPLLTRTGKRVR